MSFLTKEQLDKYVKDLASKSPKTTSLRNVQSRSPSLRKVPPNSPLSTSTTSSSSISTGASPILTEEKKVGVLHGPRSPPSNRTATTSPRASVFHNSDSQLSEIGPTSIPEPTAQDANAGSSLNEIKPTPIPEPTTQDVNTGSSLNEIKSTPIPEPTVQDVNTGSSLNEIKPTPISKPTSQDSISSNSNDNKEKKSQYKSIDDIVNDLSYPMETKLSFKPTSPSPQPKSNNRVSPPPKNADDPTKGSYVLSAAFRSSYGAASRTPSLKKPIIKPSPEQEQREISSNKKQRDSIMQELQNRSDTNWSARYDEAQKKFPPLNKFDKETTSPPSSSPKQNNNDIIRGGNPPQNSKPITPPTSNTNQTIRPVSITSISSKLVCAACEKSISGNVLNALGKKWHPDHFVCKECGIPLEHVSFFENNGYPYCHLDFHELFSPRCGHCNTPIEGQVINALGKSWHPGHFFCRECGDPFEGGFRVHDGFPYCDKDWTKLFAPKCKGCSLHIQGEFMSALDEMWHRDCFVCMTCKQPINSSYYYVFEGKPYCDEHYKALLSR